jgi:hypothetical protein
VCVFLCVFVCVCVCVRSCVLAHVYFECVCACRVGQNCISIYTTYIYVPYIYGYIIN